MNEKTQHKNAFKRKLKLFFSVLLFVLTTGGYLFYSNTEYFLNQAVDVPQDALTFVHWLKTANGYVSDADPQIIIQNAGALGNLRSIAIHADIEGDLEPHIYYANAPGENFSNEKSFEADYTYADGVLRLSADVSAISLRVDLSDEAGVALSNFRGLALDYSFVLPLLRLIYVAFFTALALMPMYLTRGRLRSLTDNFRIFHKYTYLLVNLVKKDITTKYRRSILGLLWSVLNPLLMMMVITAVFKNIFRIQIENFPVYYLTGSLVFNFMSEATSASMTSILGAAGLIKKVYIPKYIFPLEKCLFALINGLFSFIAVLIIMPILGVSFSWTIFLFWIPLLYVLLFSAGVGMALAALTVFFRDVSHLYAVWVMAWMYMTPIIYPKDILPQSVMVIMQLNPMYYYVDYFRQVVMYGTMPGLAANLNCLIFSVVFLGLGLVVFKKTQDRFILYI